MYDPIDQCLILKVGVISYGTLVFRGLHSLGFINFKKSIVLRFLKIYLYFEL